MSLHAVRSWLPQPGAAVWRWLLALAMLALLVLSLAPSSIASALPTTGWDKGNHALGFVVLGLLGRWAWPGRTAIVLTALLAYGGLIELLQSFTPDRVAEAADLLADWVGLLLGAGLAYLLNKNFSGEST
ncbi:VanZ family protein [Variovorax paradoxus]|uniref:VanZ family protein n=1 Tax=Variovorax paradoxus TaxID=34073 RepID=UPI0028668EBB|nr:VanZ family protein [Variovorax paradoxus]MDR6454215.1 VanZ family protein [Variovorax paradoxus]